MPDNDDKFQLTGNREVFALYASERLRLESELQQILNAELTPNNIRFFAKEIINRLIDFINQAIEIYIQIAEPSNEVLNLPQKQLEETALSFFGLDSVERILDAAIDKDREIQYLLEYTSQIVEEAEQLNKVILPPSQGQYGFQRGSGTEDEATISEKAAILFLILRDNFNNPDLVVKTGNIRGDMMRRTSYIFIDIPSLNRLVLVNNERGNASFVIDTEVLASMELTAENILDLTKTELNALLDSNQRLGRSVHYSPSWSDRMMALLEDMETRIDVNQVDFPRVSRGELDPMRGFVEIEGNYYGTVRAICKKLNLAKATVDNVVEGSRSVEGIDANGSHRTLYSLEDVQKLLDHLLSLQTVETEGEWRGYLFDQEKGTYYGPILTIANRLGISDGYLTKRIRNSQDEEITLTTRQARDLVGRQTVLYSFDELRELVKDFLMKPKVSRVENGSDWEGFLTLNGRHYGPVRAISDRLTSELDIYNRVNKIIKELNLVPVVGKDLSDREIDLYEFEAIKEHYDTVFSLPKINSEGQYIDTSGRKYLSNVGMKKAFSIGGSTVERIIKEANARTLKARDTQDRVITIRDYEDVEKWIKAWKNR